MKPEELLRRARSYVHTLYVDSVLCSHRTIEKTVTYVYFPYNVKTKVDPDVMITTCHLSLSSCNMPLKNAKKKLNLSHISKPLGIEVCGSVPASDFNDPETNSQ